MSAPETFLDGRVNLHCGDSRDVLRALPDASIHAVVTDPPYALAAPARDYSGAREGATGAYARASAGFMGQAWDTGETAFAVEFWGEVLRVLKPGGHVVAFGGTRTDHRLKCAIEDAGFEIRNTILDLMCLDPIVRDFVQSLTDTQFSAFLRVMDLLGFEGLLAWVYGTGFPKSHDAAKGIDRVAGATREVVATKRKTQSFADGQVFGSQPDKGGVQEITAPATAAAAAVAGWGTALKPAWEPVILARKPLAGTVAETVLGHGTGALNIDGCRIGDDVRHAAFTSLAPCAGNRLGTAGTAEARRGTQGPVKTYVGRWPANVVHDGSLEVVAGFPERSSRFFYSAKADADDRLGSKHPTVKPVDLMQWLCRLVTPPGGVVLDPFAGTGTTGEAAWREGFSAVLIEREAQYQDDIRRRMALCRAGPAERKREAVKARGASTADDHGPLFGGSDTNRGGGRTVYGTFAGDHRPDGQSARSASKDE